MPQQKINEDILLLLVENNGIIDTTTVKIDNRIEYESIILKKICEGGNDNINEIINFINKLIKPKLPNKVFNYCQSLDDPYQSVIVDIEEKIQEIRNLKNSLYAKQEEFIKKSEQEYKDKFANPYNAAKYGYIDDVIEPRNTRFRVIRALQSLATKKDVNPPKKHDNLPL